MYLSGGLCFSEIGRFKRALRITRLLEMLWVYCFDESPTNLFIMDVSPFESSNSTACETKWSSGAACAPELPSKELAIKRNQKHLTGLWKHLGDLVLLRRKVIYVLLRMKSLLDIACVVLFVSESSIQTLLTWFRAKHWAQLHQRTELLWMLSGDFIFTEPLEIILSDASQGIQIPQLHNYLMI